MPNTATLDRWSPGFVRGILNMFAPTGTFAHIQITHPNDIIYTCHLRMNQNTGYTQRFWLFRFRDFGPNGGSTARGTGPQAPECRNANRSRQTGKVKCTRSDFLSFFGTQEINPRVSLWIVTGWVVYILVSDICYSSDTVCVINYKITEPSCGRMVCDYAKWVTLALLHVLFHYLVNRMLDWDL